MPPLFVVFIPKLMYFGSAYFVIEGMFGLFNVTRLRTDASSDAPPTHELDNVAQRFAASVLPTFITFFFPLVKSFAHHLYMAWICQ